jgi:hypothetical protein
MPELDEEPGEPVSGAVAAAAARRRNRAPWIIGAALIVVGGVVAALVSGGGSGSSDTSSGRLPAGGQMTVVTDAAPPKKGDKVVAAGATSVHGAHYEVVLSTPATTNPTRAAAPLFINEYSGKPAKLLQRLQMPHPWAQDSTIANFKVEANPDPNPGKTASMALSWYLHVGDKSGITHYFEITPHGIQAD